MASSDTDAVRGMVDRQLRARGIRDPAVLAAMATVPRVEFVPPRLREFAFSDSALPIEGEQTISQPYIVALMTEALELRESDRVLEVGTGSGYAAAVLATIAAEVWTIERLPELADTAAERLRRLGYRNVRVLCGDGTKGAPEGAPFDAIVVAAGGPAVPRSLREQLAVGGRLVIPVGATLREQELVRVRRVAADDWREERLGGVRFVPLIGDEGWDRKDGRGARRTRPTGPVPAPARARADLSATIAARAETFTGADGVATDALLGRLRDARVVLLGESTHGTSEFYRARAALSRALIERHGCRAVAIEADWPDAARLDAWVKGRASEAEWRAWQEDARFPAWMWRNAEMLEFVAWLREHNAGLPPERQVSCHGLDLYSMYGSIRAVLDYLDSVDPEAARIARERYGCLSPWESDPMLYGRVAGSRGFSDCEDAVIAMLTHLLEERLRYVEQNGERFFDAVQNARLIAGAERYYRSVYRGAVTSWNVRDRHMFDTLLEILDFHGADARVVVWEHNSHVGDAAATEMAARGEHNLGHLCRTRFGDAARLVGFGTDRGRVAAAAHWDGPVEILELRPARDDSSERLCRDTRLPSFVLPLGTTRDDPALADLHRPRLQRAVGVIYRPDSELQSHYFQAVLPRQFDEWIWFAETDAVQPLGGVTDPERAPETWPSGL